MNKVTVLLTAAGNAYMHGTAKSLKENGEREIRLIGADMNKDDTILEMFDAYYQVPRCDDDSYLDRLLEICRKEKVDVLIPIMSAELELLSANIDKFLQLGTVLSISNLEALRIANDKLALFDFMKANDIACANYYPISSYEDIDKAVETVGYPVVFKTAQGSGSRGTRIVDPNISKYDILFHQKPSSYYIDLDEFKQILHGRDFPQMLAMEYLPGTEYSVDMLCDNGKVNYCLCRQGLNVSTSIILDGVVVDKPEIIRLCNEVAQKLKLSGNIGFDVKERSDGTPVIMECNPRATAGICEFTASGANLLYLCVKQCLKEELPELNVEYGVVMKRRYIEMYTK